MQDHATPHRRLLALALVAFAQTGAPPVGAAPPEFQTGSEVCGFLGDRLRGLPDLDSFEIRGSRGEAVELVLRARDDPRNRGRVAALSLSRRGNRDRRTRLGPLPLRIQRLLLSSAPYVIRVAQPHWRLPPQPLARALVRRPEPLYAGEYCVGVRSSGDAAATLEGHADVEVQWVALASGAPALPPFSRATSGAGDGRIQPEFPLRGGRVYGLIVTRGVADSEGRPLEADADFQPLPRRRPAVPGGPVALYRHDVLDPANPFPDARLVREDGSILIPDRFALRGLDPSDGSLAASRARLRIVADQLEQHLRGFSTTAPVRLALSSEVDLATLTPENVLFFERTDGSLDLEGLLRVAARHGVRPRDVALALSFPTQRIEPELRQVRERLLERAALGDLDAALGPVFDGSTPFFGAYLAANPEVRAVAVGLLPAPEFRGSDGLFDPERVAGADPAPVTLLPFFLTVPAEGSPPHPIAIVQHGFGGDRTAVLDVGPLLASSGIAAIGIDAVDHGVRGNPISLVTATPLVVREVFRQTNADQMALVRAIERGIDLDRDGAPDFATHRPGYLGISFGGLVGGVLAGVEDALGPAVLNVMGGRVALLGQAPGVRDITQILLAGAVGLLPGTPGFETYLARLLELGELGQNPADSLNWARRWRQRPRSHTPLRRLLLQEGEGDDLVINAFTEELARVAHLASNAPASDPGGVAGHWTFAPPGGHGIFARDDVRSQARAYLASDGTEIVDPSPLP